MTIYERRLAQFVDRTRELERFCAMLANRNKPIMVVTGDTGSGKSSLIARMMHECSLQSLKKTDVVWTDTRNYNYLALMRKIRDDLGAIYFANFTTLVNAYYDPTMRVELTITSTGAVNVGSGMQVATGAQVGNIAGINVEQAVIRDCMFVNPRTDRDIPEEERRTRLTDTFLTDFAAVPEDPTIVIFFDAVEKMTSETRAWIWDELMMAICNGRLKNVCAVHCGQVKASISNDLRSMVEDSALGPLGIPDIQEYLIKRDAPCPPTAISEIAKAIFGFSKGQPLGVATAVDSYIEVSRSTA
jgi:GTPase SAR1 family protein